MRVKVFSASALRVKFLALEDGEVKDKFESRDVYLVVRKGDVFEVNRDEMSEDQFEIVNE